MTRARLVISGLVMGVVAGGAVGGGLRAQSPARSDPGDAAVTALVAEVRGLRADLAAAGRSQLRAQLLLGRVQMQEQRLAYLDKQRSDAAAQAAAQSQMASMMRTQIQQGGGGEACSRAPADRRRDCEANAAVFKQQLDAQDQREQQLRTWQNELENAIAAEQARWSQFNTQLDELERTLR